jgi:hypothetical protein
MSLFSVFLKRKAIGEQPEQQVEPTNRKKRDGC